MFYCRHQHHPHTSTTNIIITIPTQPSSSSYQHNQHHYHRFHKTVFIPRPPQDHLFDTRMMDSLEGKQSAWSACDAVNPLTDEIRSTLLTLTPHFHSLLIISPLSIFSSLLAVGCILVTMTMVVMMVKIVVMAMMMMIVVVVMKKMMVIAVVVKKLSWHRQSCLQKVQHSTDENSSHNLLEYNNRRADEDAIIKCCAGRIDTDLHEKFNQAWPAVEKMSSGPLRAWLEHAIIQEPPSLFASAAEWVDG